MWPDAPSGGTAAAILDGVGAMKLNGIQQLSVLACCTGLVLAIMAGLAWLNRAHTFDHWAMLVAAIGGFELFLFGQDMKTKRRRRG